MAERPLLFDKYPTLREKVAFTSFGQYPSPVERLPALSDLTGTEVWIKRDDGASDVYGGNKCRMMEWIIANAAAMGYKSLVTWGAIGSNQILSSVIFGKLGGFDDITAVYGQQPYHPYAKRNFLISTALGVKQIVTNNEFGPAFVFKTKAIHLLKRLTGKRPFLVPLVGSSPVSVLSFLDAALEMKQQIEQGACPKPDYIFVTVGTGGTAAGLMLGEMAFGDIGHVVGVRVLDDPFVSESVIAGEINETVGFLRTHGVDLAIPEARSGDISMLHDFLGKGYAETTQEGMDAIRHIKEIEGIDLDVTYTGKTMAGMLEFMKQHKGKRFLFWHTLNNVDLSPYTDKIAGVCLP